MPTLRWRAAACLDVVPCQQQVPAGVADLRHSEGGQHQRVSPRSAHTAAAAGARRRCGRARCARACAGQRAHTHLAGRQL
eukprot:3083100-Prymnesium_polylepis.1